MQRSYTRPVLAIVLVLAFVSIGLAATSQAALVAPGSVAIRSDNGAGRERVKMYTGTVDGPYRWGWKSKDIQSDAWGGWGGTLPYATCDHSICASPDQALQFVVGGYGNGPKDGCYKNDLISRTWTQCANMPLALCNGDADILGDTLYFISGYDYGSGQCIDTMFKYSITGNNWVGAPGPFASSQYGWEPCVVACAGKVYRMGGCSSPGNYGANDQCWAYTPGSGWAQMANMNDGRAFSCAWAWSDSLWMATGFGSSSAATVMCEVYDPATNVWSDAAFTDLPSSPDNGVWGGSGGCPYICDFGFIYAGANAGFSYCTGKYEWSYETRAWTWSSGITSDYRGEGCGNTFQQGISGGGAPFGGATHVEYNTWEIAIRNNDVGVAHFVEPTGSMLNRGQEYTPTVWVKNFGVLEQSGFDVWFVVDSAGTDIYSYAQYVFDIIPGFDSVQIAFDTHWFVPDTLWAGYSIDAYTDLPGDEKPGNDRIQMVAMTTADTAYSYTPSAAPTLDGYLADDEWTDAYYINCSNVYGWNGFRPSASSGFAYFKHDNAYMYFAFGFPNQTTRGVGDQVGLYVDENNNDAWETNSSEGNYWFLVNQYGVDEVQFRPMTPSGPGTPGVSPGATCASSVFNGFFVFEGRIPIGILPYQLKVVPAGDTLGFWMFQAKAGSSFSGWWRSGLPDTSWDDPSLYGALILKSLQAPGDLGVTEIVYPKGNIDSGAAVVPSAKVRNFGASALGCTAWFMMNDGTDAEVYRQSAVVAPVPVGTEVTVVFPTWAKPHALGPYTTRCSLAITDLNSANNMKDGAFTVQVAPPYPQGWAEVGSVPSSPSGKAVKDGGSSAYDAGTQAIYTNKGNKTNDFAKFDPLTDGWTPKKDKPAGREAKPNGKGAAIASDGNGMLYSTKGNNTLGFYEYSAALDSWVQKPDVPMGGGKKVKGGTGLAYADGAVYVLKGYKNEFYKYNPTDSTWTTLPVAPVGGNQKWDKGSWIVSDGQHTLYAHKAKYHEFYKYDTEMDTWSAALTPMPIPGKAGNKKSKDGGSAAWFEDQIYAFKGGNTNEFWRYTPLGDSWREQDSIPKVGTTGKKKKVKAGASLAGYPGIGVFGTKGNKCLEFWRFVPYTPVMDQPSREGITAGSFDIGNVSFAIAPNPLSGGFATVRYSLPKAGSATLYVYDVMGRPMLTQAMVAGRTGTASLDLRKLNTGVYLVKVTTEGFSTTQKLVVQH